MKTKNTQSEHIEKHIAKFDDLTEKRDTYSVDSDSQTSQNNVIIKSKIKRTNR